MPSFTLGGAARKRYVSPSHVWLNHVLTLLLPFLRSVLSVMSFGGKYTVDASHYVNDLTTFPVFRRIAFAGRNDG